jgi:dTDP-4-amino-4,6-dideoxygalactose transaminase
MDDLTVTDDVSDRLLRLPLWPDMRDEDVDRVLAVVNDPA